MDGVLGSLVCWGYPAHVRGWGWVGFKVPSHPVMQWFYSSARMSLSQASPCILQASF